MTKQAKHEPYRILILGAGRGGTDFLKMLLSEDIAQVVGIMDREQAAEGIDLARRHHIPIYIDAEQALRECAPCLAINLTGDYQLSAIATQILGPGCTIGGLEAKFFWQMITKLKNAHDELQQSQARFETLFDSSSDGLFLLDMQGSFIDINRTAHERLGYSKAEMLDMNITELTPPEFAARVPERLQLIMLHGMAVFETAHYAKDGSAMPVEVSSRIIELDGEKAILSVIRDISERKLAETNLRIAATAFEAQESMVITDADGVILRVNHAFTETTGYTAEEAVGKTPRILKSDRHDATFYAEMWASIRSKGSWRGEIWDRRKNGEVYPKWLSISAVKGSDGEVTHYVGSHIDITERKAAEEEVKNLAFYDPLTRLPNRRLLLDRLKHALAASARSRRKGALLFIDLDNFKTLNDTLGHNMGDLLLQQAAQRLLACVRDSDTVARLGGDEFVMLLEELSPQAMDAAAQTEAIGEKILASLGHPYLLDGQECHSTPSIGATLFNSERYDMDELFKQADIAMYQAKKAGRNSIRFFDPQMQESINARVALESELRTAIEKQQFTLYYQLQVDSLHRPLGVEALIRWQHPEHGFISPAQFIPLAEETGLILPIGQWVLDTACAQIRAWQQNPLTRNLILALNVSAKQFHQADFVSQVMHAVQRHGINPKLLKLELTESMLLADVKDTIASIKALNEIGIQFSLDDFGTGYSSLQYLKLLPLDQLKIDQSFVKDIAVDGNDKAIVDTIIAMAHSMGMDVIAEGVETEEQRQLLMNGGCTHYQGFLFSKPVPIELFTVQLTESAMRVEAEAARRISNAVCPLIFVEQTAD